MRIKEGLATLAVVLLTLAAFLPAATPALASPMTVPTWLPMAGAATLPPPVQWSKTFGISAEDVGYSVQQTGDGGYIVAGSTLSLGPDLSEVYLIKTDAAGNMMWSSTFGGIYNDYGYSVQQTGDGGYIIAGTTASFGAGLYDVYLIKTDAGGNMTWSKTFGGTNADEGYSVRQTADGGYIIVGYTLSFGASGTDVYLIKTDASGNMTWSQTFGGANPDYGYSVQQTTDTGYIIAGSTQSFGTGGSDVYLIKLGPSVAPLAIRTGSVFFIAANSARLTGALTSLGTAASTNVSFQWGLSSGNYTYETAPTTQNSTGSFSANLTGLFANTTYFFRGKAVGDDIVYGDEKSFTTLPMVIPGDANTDGNVDSLDITAVERIIVGWDAPTPGADANQDGKINALDITKVERIIARLD